MQPCYIEGITCIGQPETRWLIEFLHSNIQERLLENCKLDSQSAYRQASSLDLTHKNSEAYNMATSPFANSTIYPTEVQHYENVSCPLAISFSRKKSLPISNKKSPVLGACCSGQLLKRNIRSTKELPCHAC